MNAVEIAIVAVILFVIINGWNILNPKLDWNFETEERLLWYNDPFDHFTRKSIRLYRKKS